MQSFLYFLFIFPIEKGGWGVSGPRMLNSKKQISITALFYIVVYPVPSMLLSQHSKVYWHQTSWCLLLQVIKNTTVCIRHRDSRDTLHIALRHDCASAYVHLQCLLVCVVCLCLCGFGVVCVSICWCLCACVCV